MKNRRYSGYDKHLWPFTLSKHKGSSWRPLGVVLDSGAREGGRGDCHIAFSALGWTIICELPPIISDYCVRHEATSWSAETIARMGRSWYIERFPREYGFRFSDGSLHTYFGPQTHDSRTTKSRVFFLPWREWRFIRLSHYDLKGNHFHTEFQRTRNDWTASEAVRKACPKASFEFDDYDGQRIVATTYIEEREWHFGTGWCKWLSWFRKPKISRDLKIEFSNEVGPEKGSWKGGTVGHAIEMLPGELHEAAFKRYCEQEHRSKYRRFRITYVGPVDQKPALDARSRHESAAGEIQ